MVATYLLSILRGPTFHLPASTAPNSLLINPIAREKCDLHPPAKQHHETYDVGHGRKEQRFYYSTPVPETLRHREAWRDLASVGCVVTATEREGKETGEVRYYISDQKDRKS